MPRSARHVVRVLACLLLLQWAAAVLPHARAMAQRAAAQLSEICTHEGTRQVLLDENGQPIKVDQATDCCDLGIGPAVLAPAGSSVLASPAAYGLVVERYGREGLPACPPRAPPQQPRAPPVF